MFIYFICIFRLPSDAIKKNLKRLLKESKFEIVTGGWVMTDEAPTHYFDMLDQLIEGHQFLKTTLNYYPHNSYSIDPFGHSSTFPYLLQKSGISNIYIQRTHFAWKRHLSETKSLEFFWRHFFQNTSNDFKPLICHMSPLDLYSFKYACGPDFKACLEYDFRKIFGESSESTAIPLNSTNIEKKAFKILEQYSKLGSLFSHNVALVLLGDDFRFNFDIEWQQQYKNYNMLMSYVNTNREKFNDTQIQFGTLQDYFEAVNERLPIQLGNYPSLYGDFIPYADVYVNSVPNYWTGYYTTRPFYKRLSRELQYWLRSTEILYSLSRNQLRTNLKNCYILDKEYMQLTNARQNLALFQHHDGITGTSRDFVMEDYGRRISHSISNLMELAALSIQMLNSNSVINLDNISKPFIHSHLYRTNYDRITEKHILRVPADENGFQLAIFNTVLQKRNELIKIFVEDPFVKIIDLESNNKIDFQINPIFNNHVLSSNAFEVEFTDILYPLSLKNYKILTNEENIHSKVKIIHLNEKKSNSEKTKFNSTNAAFILEESTSPTIVLQNDLMHIDIDRSSGFIDQIFCKHTNTKQKVEMSFLAYNSEPGDSGAYLFKPVVNNGIDSLITSSLGKPKYNLYKGEISSTLVVNYTAIAYTITLYNSRSQPLNAGIELKLMVNLEDNAAFNNKELVLRFKTQINNRVVKENRHYRTFYVDSNGFQMVQRFFVEEIGVEGNYYPMTTAIFIEDINSRFTLLSSSAHGVTSPEDGAIEVMLDRRILEDDKRGLSQGITDNLPVELSFWLLFEYYKPSLNLTTDLIAALSPLADALLLQLNYPSIITYSYKSENEIETKDDTIYYSNRILIKPNIFCDYFLLNFRTLPEHNHFLRPSNSSLLLLHNRALSKHNWQSPYLMDQCDNNNNNNNSTGLTHLFTGLKVKSIEASSLTGLHMKHRLYSLSQMKVNMFEINSYNLTFGT